VCYILVLCKIDAEAEETTERQAYNTIVFYVTYQPRLKKQVNDEYKYKVTTQRWVINFTKWILNAGVCKSQIHVQSTDILVNVEETWF
jgi:hypothetical protein